MKRRVVILGSGIAGYSAAQAIGRTGEEVHLTVVSADPHPTYSACVFAEYIAGEIERERVFLKGQDRADLVPPESVLAQQAIGIDPEDKEIRLRSGRVLAYDRLILATGSRAVVPRLPGVDRQGVTCLKTLPEADALLRAEGKAAVVVGSGPVGLEVAVALRKRGWDVSVIELLEHILPRLFSPVQSRTIHTLLERQGIRVMAGERLLGIAGEKRVEAVTTDRRTLPCQLVLLGIGMQPEVSLAARAGLRIGPSGGLCVDPSMQTSCEDVFACGDCVESIDRLSGKPSLNMLWGNAKMQGAVAGLNSLGLRRRYPGALNLTTLKLYETVAASVGEVGLPDTSYQEIVKGYGEHGSIRLVVKEGLVKGIQTVGPQVDFSIFLNMMLCGERLHILRESRDKRSLIEQKPWLVRLPTYLRE
jgi:NADH oxidase (H2O2-forming)